MRIENTLLIVPAESTAFGDFLKFETLTLAPIDTAPIVLEMLSTEEREWLNNYQLSCFMKVCFHIWKATIKNG